MEQMEGLEALDSLNNLNLSDNFIKRIEGLGALKNLGTLQLKNNRIGMEGVEDVIRLLECPAISVLDLSNNKLEDPAVVSEVFKKMQNLKVLYLQGNPFVKKIKNYRKRMIADFPELKYLDDRPVFAEDRRYAEAWARGGPEEEKRERVKVKEEKEEADRRNREAFREMVDNARAERIANQAAAHAAG